MTRPTALLALAALLAACAVSAAAPPPGPAPATREAGRDLGGVAATHPDPGQSPAGRGAAQVVRVAGADRVGTAVAVSAAGWEAAGTVLVASAGDFPDGLAAASLAGPFDAPLLLTPRDSLPDAVAQEVTRLGAEEAIVLGGASAVSDAVVADLAALTGNAYRVAGPDRFATAAAAAELAGQGAGGHAVVASGRSHADALAAAPLLAAGDGLLLTEPGGLPDATAAALEGVERVTVVGGTAAVSDGVVAELEARGIAVTRIAGDDRYATALAIASALPPAERPVLLAAGQTFADALAAGPLAVHTGAAVLTTPQPRLTDGVEAHLRQAQPPAATVIGGSAAVGDFALAEAQAALAGTPRPGFQGSAQPLPGDVRAAMTGVSWRPGCPVGLDELALLDVTFFGFDGQVHPGRLVVHADAAQQILQVFGDLFAATFALQRVELVDTYGADDDASMAANNTSAFNCRAVAGTTTWSQHAYGTAIDLNPVQNPYVRGASFEPPGGGPYLDRGDVRPGMIVRPGPVVDAFAAIGWPWGGDWDNSKDYQHFSANGR